MTSPKKVQELVQRFAENFEDYRGGKYNEAQVRREYIDPLFKCLGWDIDNESGQSEAFKEVIHEDSLIIDGHSKAPDYSFRIGGIRQFFLEAKKPAVNIKESDSSAYQLRRYGWSAKLGLSILTNFSELIIYDCRYKPNEDDKASFARIECISYHDYIAKWDYIYSLLSKESVLSGSLDKYSDDAKLKKGSLEVDSVFLEEIETWRELLAKDISQNNDINNRDLNVSVQKIIDRIIFLRISEDRGIEPYGSLKEAAGGENIYSNLLYLFRRADDRYNSGLFHFSAEKDRKEGVDEITPNIVIGDKVLKQIIENLYYPASPYVFSYLPADILGQIYEQFLGKVILLDDSHKSTVVFKPEVKKAGGVYYTPTHIVRLIVEETIKPLLDNKTPDQISGSVRKSKLKIVDPACGSGSFLISVYQYLLDWHLEWYSSNISDKFYKGRNPRIYKNKSNNWILTTHERKRILLEHIYGVDIDVQAVEVTKLSLLLKMLEGENDETLKSQMSLFQQRVLPDLDNNIKCGNSLVGTDFYVDHQLSLFDDEEMYKINAFDWNKEFEEIFSRGGFDVVLGNPPYLYSAGKEYGEYYIKNYNYTQYQTDFYVYFVELATRICRPGGRISYITPDSWLNSDNFSTMRNRLINDHNLESVVIFKYKVFKDANIENTIFNIVCRESTSSISVKVSNSKDNINNVNLLTKEIVTEKGFIDPYYNEEIESMIAEIEKDSKRLDHFVEINRGIHAYRTDGFGKSKFGDHSQIEKDKKEKSYHAKSKLDDTYLPEIKGKNVYRFYFEPSGEFLSYGSWLAEPREEKFFKRPKIVLRKILSKKLNGCYIEHPAAIDQSLYILISKDDNVEIKYLMGILLSSLGGWYIKNKYSIYDQLFPWYTKKQLSGFPIKFKNKEMTAKVEDIVNKIIDINQKTQNTKNINELKIFKQQLNILENQLDINVLDIYSIEKLAGS